MVRHYFLMFIVVFITIFGLLTYLKPKQIIVENTQEIDWKWVFLISFITGCLATTKFFLLLVIIPGIPPL